MSYADLELSLRRWSGDDYAAELRFQLVASSTEAHLISGTPPRVRIDFDALEDLRLEPRAYGERLTHMLCADTRVREAFAKARGLAQGAQVPLRLRLRLDASDDEVHAICWETLHDPDGVGFLCASERVLVSRYLDSADMTPLATRPRADLRAVVVVANPDGLEDYKLAPVDVAGEVGRSQVALEGITTTVIARAISGQPATLANLAAGLRDGPDILYLVAHGTLRRGRPFVWLEDEHGGIGRVEGEELIETIERLARRPLLVVLASCQSAGAGQDEGALAALGPRLASAGIAATVAMQGNITMRTVEHFMPLFFTELRRDGQIDRALAAARAAVLDRPDWWIPVLFLRVRDGRLWTEAPPPQPDADLPLSQPERPPEVAQFIGRTADLTYFAEKLAATHIAVITGLAGVGKTALAAELARRTAEPERIFWHSFHEHEGIDVIIWKLAGILAWNGQPDILRMLHTTRQTGGQTPPPEVLFDFLIQNVRGQGYVLCFDDFQFVDEDPLVSHLGRRLRSVVQAGELALIITSRRTPSFVQTVDFVPLAGLSVEDAGRLVAARGLTLSDDLAASLYARTEGNSQLLTLAIDALQHASNPARMITQLSESSSIERYLMTEVDRGLPGHERDVMSGVSVLMRYPATRDPIEAVLDSSGVRRTLSDLASRYLLAVHEGEYGAEYDQHAIVQEFYYNALGRRDRQTMHRRAGTYYETEEQDALKAARHFERIGEYTHAAELATSNVEAQINQGQARALLHLLESLPAPRLTPELRLCVEETAGDIQYLLGDLDGAIARYTGAGKAALQADALTQARLHRKLGEVLERRSRHDEALAALTRGRALLAEANAAEEQARLAAVYGTVLFNIGRYDEAVAEAQTTLHTIPDEAINPRIAADLHDLIGKVQFRRGRFAQSLEQFQSALELRKMNTDQQGMIRSYSNLAVVYGEQSRYAEALQVNQAALEIAERIGDTVALAVLYRNMATDYQDQGQYDRAIDLYRQGLILNERTGDTRELAACYYNLGETYRILGTFELAIDYLLKGIEFAEQVHAHPDVIAGLKTLAEIYLAQGRIEDALSSCLDARRREEEIGDLVLRPWNAHLLGRIYCCQQQWGEARAAFEEACQLWRERELPVELAETLLHWARLERDTGQFDRTQSLCEEAISIAEAQEADELLEQLTALRAELADDPGGR